MCVQWCNPTNRLDANLVQIAEANLNNQDHLRGRGRGRRAQSHRAQRQAVGRHLQRSFNFEASEQLNAFLEPFSATLTKMRPKNHDLFLCIILKLRADKIMKDSTPLNPH